MTMLPLCRPTAGRCGSLSRDLDRRGVAGTIELLTRSLRTGGIILIGPAHRGKVTAYEEVAKACFANSVSDFLMLPGLLASFGHLGNDVVEMVLADQDGWDRYEAAKWLTMRRWLEANPDDELAKMFEPY